MRQIADLAATSLITFVICAIVSALAMWLWGHQALYLVALAFIFIAACLAVELLTREE